MNTDFALLICESLRPATPATSTRGGVLAVGICVLKDLVSQPEGLEFGFLGVSILMALMA
jgi:hypothetical protein